MLFGLILFSLFAGIEALTSLPPLMNAAVVLSVGCTSWYFLRRSNISARHSFVDTAANDLRKMCFGKTTPYQPGTSFHDLDELYMEARGVLQQLSARLSSVLSKRDESDAVLASMMEGVIAVDSDARILTINASAQKLLRVAVPPQSSPSIEEIIPNSSFVELIQTLLETHEPIEAEVIIGGDEETILQVHGSPLQESGRGSIGAVLVFHDITKLRKLETIRRDFVANVSHELKTPITSIKGFVETLLDGALENKEDSERFLGIVSRQADRLTAIIEDLLCLSRLEQEDEGQEVAREVTTLHEIVERSCQACLLKAGEKKISFVREIDRSILMNVNPHLVEQALINLLTNAVKYSHERGKIFVRALLDENDITLMVVDEGIGIPKKDLPRLFERFYRVDRARSRMMGGTGLGLAIVKHIAQAHDGHVRVESTVNQGSTFFIFLPDAVLNGAELAEIKESAPLSAIENL